jgi:Superfamily I DNA and RNA helicases
MASFVLRPQQSQVVGSRARFVGVSSVPGSGKSETIARAGAEIILRGQLADDQEILLVTFSRSATGNFKRRIRRVLKEAGHIANGGYRVTTLHGLAHQIVRERHEVVGLEANFNVLDDQLSGHLISQAVNYWLSLEKNKDRGIKNYLNTDKAEEYLKQCVNEDWPVTLRQMAGNFIKQAKDLCLTPVEIDQRLTRYGVSLELAKVCNEIYHSYQYLLRQQAALDYSDLLMEAYHILTLRPDYLAELQYRWPCILEDEAQDSCVLQEKILRLIANDRGRWFRVGDPNQAIYESFTTADPKLLINFLKEADQKIDLPVSGRSSQCIIDLANHLMTWSEEQDTNETLQDALVQPTIRPTEPGDTQPNPPAEPERIQFVNRGLKDDEELRAVLDAAQAWAGEHPQETCAILVYDNARGQDFIAAMQKRGMEYRELLRNSSEASDVARVLGAALQFLDDPTKPRRLEILFRKWQREAIEKADPEDRAVYTEISEWLNSIQAVEDYLYPLSADDDPIMVMPANSRKQQILREFAVHVRRWLDEKHFSIDQLVLTVAQDMFHNAADLATAYQIARLLTMEVDINQQITLGDMSAKLRDIMEQKRQIAGLANDDLNFRPDDYPGEVVVSTMHRAKGLEWDQVFLVGLNDFTFPFALGTDYYLGQKAYVRNGLILTEEALGQLDALSQDTISEYDVYEEGQATTKARIKIAAERLRLLFVGITRAKRGLQLSWNTGRFDRSRPCEAYRELYKFWGKNKVPYAEEQREVSI